jgi:hypothetical protein
MATTSGIKEQLYPFATEDSKAIPLDVIRPLSLIIKSFLGTGVAAALIIPLNWKLATFFSPVGCLIEFAAETLTNPVTDGIEYANTLFVPPNCIVTSTVLVGVARVISIDNDTAGFVVAQQIQKWAGLALARQVSKI